MKSAGLKPAGVNAGRIKAAGMHSARVESAGMEPARIESTRVEPTRLKSASVETPGGKASAVKSAAETAGIRDLDSNQHQRHSDQETKNCFHGICFQEIIRIVLLPFGNGPHLPALTRTIRTGGVSGSRTPSKVRFTDCHVKLSASTGVKMLTALLSLPSRNTPVASSTHFEPSLIQNVVAKTSLRVEVQ